MTGLRTTLLVPEPPFPDDGLCLVCGKPIRTTKLHGPPDAFCRSQCARDWFGTQGLAGKPHPENQPPQDET